MKIRNIYLSSLTSIAVLSSAAAFSNQGVYVPELEGGVTATVGAWMATPSSTQVAPIASIDDNDNFETLNVTPGYDVGIEASLGYVFEDTANGVEFFFRNFDTNDTTDFLASNLTDINDVPVSKNVGYELTAFDLMFNQFMNIGQHMQMRFGAGASYVELDQNNNANVTTLNGNEFVEQGSEYSGWGPRLAIDARYDFGNHIEGLGIVAGGSVAYFLGDLDSNTVNLEIENRTINSENINNNLDSHAVTNLRGNVGIDYVYFFSNDEKSTLGLEVGYQVDYYSDAVAFTEVTNATTGTNTEATTFSGPYVQLKGAF